MGRHGDRFLLSSWPDNPVIGTAEGIRKEKRKGGKQQMWAKGEKITQRRSRREGGQERSEEAAFRASPSIPHAPARQGWG